MTAVAASGFTYFHKRYCIVNLQLKRDRWYYFAQFTVTIKLIQLFYLQLKLFKMYIQLKVIISVTVSYHSYKPYYIRVQYKIKKKAGDAMYL